MSAINLKLKAPGKCFHFTKEPQQKNFASKTRLYGPATFIPDQLTLLMEDQRCPLLDGNKTTTLKESLSELLWIVTNLNLKKKNIS